MIYKLYNNKSIFENAIFSKYNRVPRPKGLRTPIKIYYLIVYFYKGQRAHNSKLKASLPCSSGSVG